MASSYSSNLSSSGGPKMRSPPVSVSSSPVSHSLQPPASSNSQLSRSDSSNVIIGDPLLESFLEHARNGNVNAIREIIEQNRCALSPSSQPSRRTKMLTETNDDELDNLSCSLLADRFDINYRG
jgi:hypothetical protein